MSLITSFDTDINFWVANPQFKTMNPFKKLHNSDKSRGKGRSSKVMWYVAQAVDEGSNNIYKNVLPEDRLDILSTDFMEEEDWHVKNEEMLEPFLNRYEALNTTPAKKALREWNLKIIERSRFIKETPYTTDSYEMDSTTGKFLKIAGTSKELDAMMKNSKQIYDLFQDIMKAFGEEEESSQVKGGQNLSLSDLGKI